MSLALHAVKTWCLAATAKISLGKLELFLPLPPGEAAAQRRVRDCGVMVSVIPSSPALLPKGEGLGYPSPRGRGEGVRDGFQVVADYFVRETLNKLSFRA